MILTFSSVKSKISFSFDCSIIFKGWFPYDHRRSWITDHKNFCDLLQSYGNALLRSSMILQLWSQTIADKDRTMFYLLRSFAIVCNQLRLCNRMQTKVLRSAILNVLHTPNANMADHSVVARGELHEASWKRG